MQTKPHRQLITDCLDRSASDQDWLEFDRRYRPRLVAGLRRGLSYSFQETNRDLIEELVQDCYCRLLDRDRKILHDCLVLEREQVGAYLLQVGRSVALDWLRHRGAAKRGHDTTQTVDQDWLAEVNSEAPTVERQLLAQETLESFWGECRSIAQAIGNPRSLLFLHQAWFQQLPSREIAAAAGVATSTVDSVVCRMRERLAKRGWQVARRS